MMHGLSNTTQIITRKKSKQGAQLQISKPKLKPKLKLNSAWVENSGQGLVEYIILVALIAVGSIAVVRTLSVNISKQYENINVALGAESNGKQQVLRASPKSATEKRDLSNFLKGAVSSNSKQGSEDDSN